jgi:hypothetical protein
MKFFPTYLSYLLPATLLCLMLCACEKAETPRPTPVDRTLLVYLCADNNLADDARGNLDALVQGMAAPGAGSSDTHLVVYLDTPEGNPRLLEVTAAGAKEVYTWPAQHDSASPDVMRSVIERVCRDYPAARYGLVLSSHGMAWVPSTATAYFTRSRSRTGEEWPATKYFGQDDNPGPTGYLETEELVAALPDGRFDYILFDACFMASVEVEYALRAKADYIIAAPTEVISDGFPYADIIGELLAAKPDLKAVCRTYYEHYAAHPDSRYHSAAVSLVRTSELEALCDVHARLWRSALAHDPSVFAEFNLSGIQRLDRYRRPFLFDLGSIVGRLETMGAISTAGADQWRQQLARTVVYEAHTPVFFDLAIAECSGLSGYIPVASYPDLNEYYIKLAWSAYNRNAVL